MKIIKKNNIENRLTLLLSHSILIIFCCVCLLPIMIVLSSSLSSENAIVSNGYSIIPHDFSFKAYEYIFKNPKDIINAYFISISVSILGMVLGLLINSMIAYPLSRRDFKYRKKVSFYVFFTMLFSGGLVPFYILIINLKLKDNFWVLVLPYLVAAWNILLLRTFFQSIPMALVESAKIDGSSEFGIFFKIIMPLSKPALATVGLLISFTYWNDYWLGLLFISNKKLVSLQYMFYKIMANLEYYIRNMQFFRGSISVNSLPTQSTRMAVCILIIAPMLVFFTIFQKYLVKGMIVGSVKG